VERRARSWRTTLLPSIRPSAIGGPVSLDQLTQPKPYALPFGMLVQIRKSSLEQHLIQQRVGQRR
jgi:hypothetical protein